jgi:hypothetical protein
MIKAQVTLAGSIVSVGELWDEIFEMSSPTGREIKKRPLGQISWPTTGDQPIEIIAGSIPNLCTASPLMLP